MGIWQYSTVSLVYTSFARSRAVVQAPRDALAGTIMALSPRLDLGVVFSGLPPASHYILRCVVCFFGHHYQVLHLSSMLDQCGIPSFKLAMCCMYHAIPGFVLVSK